MFQIKLRSTSSADDSWVNVPLSCESAEVAHAIGRELCAIRATPTEYQVVLLLVDTERAALPEDAR